MEVILDGLDNSQDLVLTGPVFSETRLLVIEEAVFSEMLYSLSAIIFSSSFAIQLVRLIGRKDARSLAGFPSFSKG